MLKRTFLWILAWIIAVPVVFIAATGQSVLWFFGAILYVCVLVLILAEKNNKRDKEREKKIYQQIDADRRRRAVALLGKLQPLLDEGRYKDAQVLCDAHDTALRYLPKELFSNSDEYLDEFAEQQDRTSQREVRLSAQLGHGPTGR